MLKTHQPRDRHRGRHPGNRFHGRLHRPFIVRYVMGLALFALVSIAGYGGLAVVDHRQTSAATQASLAAQENVLAKAALGEALLVQFAPSTHVAATRATLSGTLDQLQLADVTIRDGIPAEHLPGLSKARRGLYTGPRAIDSQLMAFISRGRLVAAAGTSEASTDAAVQAMKVQVTGPLTAALAAAQATLEDDSARFMSTATVLGPLFLGSTLIIILAEGLLIFAPMSRRIRVEVENLAAAEAQQRYAAERDSLTGLVNRRYLSGLVTSYEAEALDFVLMIVDVDEFKSVNDTLGHDVGDQVLLAFAGVLRRGADARPKRALPAGSSLAGQPVGAVAGRLGGDEFLVVLPMAGLEDAAELYRGAQAALEIELEGNGLPPVTMSCGASVGGLGITWSAALKSADNALYLAKERGRNRLATEEELARQTQLGSAQGLSADWVGSSAG